MLRAVRTLARRNQCLVFALILVPGGRGAVLTDVRFIIDLGVMTFGVGGSIGGGDG